MARQIWEIAEEIRGDWKKINYAAAPYLDAMDELAEIDSMYFYDSAASVIRYFLGNATSWRGDNARRIKAELKSMIEGKY